MGLNVYTELRRIWDGVNKDEQVKDLDFDLQFHKKLLDIFQVGSYYYFIVNVRSKPGFELVSPEIEKVLGYRQEEIDLPFFLSLIHPEDQATYLNFEKAISEFFNAITGETIFRYKVQHDFRVRKPDGKYVRILNQFVVIQHDSDTVKTFVVHTDITHLKKDTKPVLSFIGLEGAPSYLNVDVKNIFRSIGNLFTTREKEILKALAGGMSSAQISESLNISKHTVDSHRKNMLKKTEAKSTNEIIRIAFNNGWI
jgi:DNA-binding CsgD family transcriptional regulator